MRKIDILVWSVVTALMLAVADAHALSRTSATAAETTEANGLIHSPRNLQPQELVQALELATMAYYEHFGLEITGVWISASSEMEPFESERPKKIWVDLSNPSLDLQNPNRLRQLAVVLALLERHFPLAVAGKSNFAIFFRNQDIVCNHIVCRQSTR